MKNEVIPTEQTSPQKTRFQGDARDLAWMEAQRDNYTPHFRKFAEFVRGIGGAVDLETIKQYYLWLNEESGFKATTIRVRRQAVKRRLADRLEFLQYTAEEKVFIKMQLEKLDKHEATKCPGAVQASVNSDKVISSEEYIKVLTAARSERQKRFIEFLYTTGCRVSEMTGVKLTDCKVVGNYVDITVKGKGNRTQKYKQRQVYIPTAMYERIRSTFAGKIYLLETGGGGRYDRSYITRQIRKATKKAIGRALSAHKLRHSFATKQIREKGRVDAVSRYLGHSDVQITMRIYSHDSFSPSDVLGPEAIAS